MQDETKPEIVAALINVVGFLGVAALGGLFVLAVMAGSIEAMRACVFTAGLAYVSQVCTTVAEFYPQGSAAAYKLRGVGFCLWLAVIVLFCLGLWLIG